MCTEVGNDYVPVLGDERRVRGALETVRQFLGQAGRADVERGILHADCEGGRVR